MRLGKVFGTTAEFWLNGQLAIDLSRAEHDDAEIKAVKAVKPVICSA
jgi:plasmid maintenance system antidote protein VapI